VAVQLNIFIRSSSTSASEPLEVIRLQLPIRAALARHSIPMNPFPFFRVIVEYLLHNELHPCW
jgi:hypothetical protein